MNNTQPDIQGFINAAKQQGYSDDEINQYLSQQGVSTDQVSQPSQQTPVLQQTTNSSQQAGLIKLLTSIASPITNYVKDTTSRLQNENAGGRLIDTGLGALGPLGQLLGKANGQGNGVAFNPTGAKAAANVASYAVPFGGPETGLIKGALVPGAAAGALQGVSQENATPTSVGQNALFGAAGAGILSKVLPGLGHVGAGIEEAGNKVIQGQYSVPPSAANALGLSDTVNKLADYGFTNIKDVSEAASKVTGADGLFSKLTRDAVSKAGPVETGAVNNVPSILDMATGLSKDPAIGKAAENKFVDFIKSGVTDINGINGANPTDTFGFIQKLEGQAASLTRGRSSYAISSQDKALAGAYSSIASELKDRLFSMSGGDKAVLNLAQNPEVLKQAASISPKLAEDLSKAQTVGDLRAIQAPFVKGSQLAQIAGNKAKNQILSLQDILAGGAAGLITKNPIMGVGATVLDKILSSNAGKSGIGGALNSIGESLSGVGGVGGNIVPKLGAFGGVGINGILNNSNSQKQQSQKGTNQENNKNQNVSQSAGSITPPTSKNQVSVDKQGHYVLPDLNSVKTDVPGQPYPIENQQKDLQRAGGNPIALEQISRYAAVNQQYVSQYLSTHQLNGSEQGFMRSAGIVNDNLNSLRDIGSNKSLTNIPQAQALLDQLKSEGISGLPSVIELFTPIGKQKLDQAQKTLTSQYQRLLPLYGYTLQGGSPINQAAPDLGSQLFGGRQ